MNEWKLPYTFSRDYALMKRLLDEGYELVCYVDNAMGGNIYRDACRARKTRNDVYVVGCRGTTFLYYFKDTVIYDSLEEAFADCNLEFIVPNQ